jgi:hypothetical protein
MRERANKHMNATQGVSLGCESYVPRTLRMEKNWERSA